MWSRAQWRSQERIYWNHGMLPRHRNKIRGINIEHQKNEILTERWGQRTSVFGSYNSLDTPGTFDINIFDITTIRAQHFFRHFVTVVSRLLVSTNLNDKWKVMEGRSAETCQSSRLSWNFFSKFVIGCLEPWNWFQFRIHILFYLEPTTVKSVCQ